MGSVPFHLLYEVTKSRKLNIERNESNPPASHCWQTDGPQLPRSLGEAPSLGNGLWILWSPLNDFTSHCSHPRLPSRGEAFWSSVMAREWTRSLGSLGYSSALLPMVGGSQMTLNRLAPSVSLRDPRPWHSTCWEMPVPSGLGAANVRKLTYICTDYLSKPGPWHQVSNW